MIPRQFLTLLGWFGVLLSVQAAPLTDAHGDPLPKGATARIGTIRMRHAEKPSSLAFTPDSKHLVSTDGDSVAVWEASTGRSLAFRFLPPQIRHWGPAVSPDGSLIACRLESGALGLLEVESGKQHCELGCKENEIHELVFSRDNRWLVVAGKESNVWLWNLKTAKLVRQWKSPDKSFDYSGRHLFTPDGKQLVQSTRAGLLLLDVESGKELYHVEPDHNEDRIDRIAISSTGKFLATDNWRGSIHIREVATGRAVHEFSAERGSCAPIFSPDGKQIFCFGTDDGVIAGWDVETGKRTRKLSGALRPNVESLAISPDGKMLAVGASDCSIRLWDMGTGKERFPDLERRLGGMTAVVLSDGKTLLANTHPPLMLPFRSFGQHLEFYDLKGKSLRRVKLDPNQAHEGAVTSDAATYALAEGSNFGVSSRPVPNKALRSSIILGEMAGGKQLTKLSNLNCQISDIDFSPDGRFLFAYAFNAGSSDDDYHRRESVHVWKRAAPNELKKVAELPSNNFMFGFLCSSDSGWIAVPTKPGWNVYHCETGKLYRSHPGLTEAIRASSPSGRALACSNDEEVTPSVVEFATGRRVCKLESDPRYLVCPRYAFSPDGRIIAGDLNTATIVLWDAFTGKQIGKLEGHRGDIRSLSFTPDGRHLVSGSADSTVLFWDYRSMLPKAAEPMRLTPERLEQLWLDLHAEDAGCAYRAVAEFVHVPEQAVALLRKKVTLPTADEQRRVQGWIDDLSNNRFAVRSRAIAELTRLSELTEPALRQALRPELPLESRRRIEELLEKMVSIRPGPWLATLRAFDVLELIATPEAKQMLEELSKGPDESPFVQEVKRTLARWAKRMAHESK